MIQIPLIKPLFKTDCDKELAKLELRIVAKRRKFLKKVGGG